MRLPALALAATLTASLNQTPGIPQASAVRFHHLHFRTDDFAAALTAAAGTHRGVRTILEGLGPGVRVGDVYLLFERPPSDAADGAADRIESAPARVDAAVEWLRTRRTSPHGCVHVSSKVLRLESAMRSESRSGG